MIIKVNAQGYVYDSSDNPVWLPPINPKQFELFNDFHRYTLVDGPRKSSKTYGVLHKVLRHTFDVNGAMFAIVNKTLKNAKSSGVWSLLCNWMLPFWEHGLKGKWEPWMPTTWRYGCPGFKVVEGPKTTGDTKLSYVKIRNAHGTVSEIQCHSLEHAHEVEAKFKGPYYSGFWCSEFDQYLTRHAFDILCDALRMPGVKYNEHQVICDCNPPESGEVNWMHDLWFKEKNNPPVNDPDFDPIFHDGLHRIPFQIDDNPQLDPDEKRELIARYKKRQGLYDRFILGKWTQDITDGHFSDVYDETVHVIGKSNCPEEEREYLVPTEQCISLLTGWDMGESKNHSFHILEKIQNVIETTDPDTGHKLHKTIISFSVLDELVVIRSYISIREFVLAALDKMNHWEKYQMKNRNIHLKWRHWSDTSAFKERSAAETSESAIAYEASNGRIILEAAPKYRDSVRDRVKLTWQFLYEKRLYVSSQLTTTRQMLANLRKGKETEFVKRDDHKHPFDSLSYPIMAEAPIDMLRSSEIIAENKEESPGIIAVRF